MRNWLPESGSPMRLELDHDFVSASRLALDADDLRLGLSLGLISPPTAAAIASNAVTRGARDPAIAELADLQSHDVPAIRATLRAVDPEEADLYPPQSVRKWVYLELKAAYELRDRLVDPLGVVELIYADFDYPSSVAAFVRYMPPPPGAATGEGPLLERWAEFLANEAVDLATGS